MLIWQMLCRQLSFQFLPCYKMHQRGWMFVNWLGNNTQMERIRQKNVKRYPGLFKCPIKVIILKIFLNLLVDLVTHVVSSVINRLFCNPHPIQYETCDYYCYVDSLKEDKPVSAATSQTKPSGLGIRNSKISYHYWLVNGSIAVSHWLFLPAPDTHHQDATNM